MKKLIYLIVPLLINTSNIEISDKANINSESNYSYLFETDIVYYLEFQENGYSADYINDSWQIYNFYFVYNNIINEPPDLQMMYTWQYDNIYNNYNYYNVLSRETLFDENIHNYINSESYMYESIISYTVMKFIIKV